MDQRIIEHGRAFPNDRNVFRKVERITEVGNTRQRIIITGVRDRIIDRSIPQNEKGYITYTEWEVIDKQIKNEFINKK